MGEWTPLIVAVVTALSAVTVGLLSQRGETVALKRLRAMTELLDLLPPDRKPTEEFEKARDHLLARVAARELRASPWPRLLQHGGAAIATGAIAINFLTIPRLGVGETDRPEMITIFWASFVAVIAVAILVASTVKSGSIFVYRVPVSPDESETRSKRKSRRTSDPDNG